MMRVFLGAIVISLIAYVTAGADTADDKNAFRTAYKSYQQAAADGKTTAARNFARQALELGEKVYGPDHKNTAALTLNYGRLIQINEDALPVLKLAIKRYEKIYGKDSAEMIDPLLDLAANSTSFRTWKRAKSIYRRAQKLAEHHYPDDKLITGSIALEMGKVALQEAHSTEALRYLLQAKKTFAATSKGVSIAKLAETNFYLGKFLLADKKYQRATEALLASLETFEKHTPNSQVTMTNHAFLIEAYEKRGLRDEATKHCRAIGSKSAIKPDQDYLPVYRAGPIYPRAAQRVSKEGYAIIELTVDKNGFVRSPIAIEVDGHSSFAAASIEAAQSFRYAPRYVDGKPVDTTGVRYRFSYNLAK